MDIIYVDELFLLNALMDYLLLLSAARLRGLRLCRRRYVLGALAGGAYAVGVVIPPLRQLAYFPFPLLTALGMALIAYGLRGAVGKNLLAFLGLSGAYAGAVYAIALLTGQTGEGILVPVSLRILLVSFAVCYALVRWVFPALPRQRERELHAVTVILNGQSADLTALRDTGNALRDPLSGRAVVIADAAALRALFPDVFFPLPADAAQALQLLAGWEPVRGRLRLLPFSAVGTGQGLLLCLRPDSVTVDGQELPLLVGLSLTPIGDGDYSAIL